MTNILDIVAEQNRLVPEDWRQYLALQLARYFGDTRRLRLYVNVTQEHPLERLEAIFRQTRNLRKDGGNTFLRRLSIHH